MLHGREHIHAVEEPVVVGVRVVLRLLERIAAQIEEQRYAQFRERFTPDAEGPAAVLKDGNPLDLQATYRVLVNSYMYEGGGKYLFSKQNSNGRVIPTSWRDPVIRWILSQRTSRERPLETLLDGTKRGPVQGR